MRKRSQLAKETVAVVLAGGKGTRLGALTRHECKPALPFGGAYRTIDFSLSNCVNSGIHRVGIATQYRDASLVRHIEQLWSPTVGPSQGSIEPWRAAAMPNGAGYRGTADAVFQNWEKIKAMDVERVLVLAGDHVYKMDYRPMLEQHARSGADVTIGCVEVPIAEASQFGVMSIDNKNRIVRFAEKPSDPEPLPDRPDRALGSMGIYVFSRDRLGQLLAEDALTGSPSHDFGRDVIPRLIGRAKVCAFPFNREAAVGGGYWRDVGTVSAYWRAHMDLLDGIAGFRLDNPDWPIQAMATTRDIGVPYTRAAGRIERSLLAIGCALDNATLHRSVLFERVTVAAEAQLSQAVVLPNAVIGRRCRLSNVIVAAGVHVPDGTVVLPKRQRGDNETPTLITAETDFSSLYAKPMPRHRELPFFAAAELAKETRHA